MLVQTPDGLTEFPDTMKPEEVEGVLRNHYANKAKLEPPPIQTVNLGGVTFAKPTDSPQGPSTAAGEAPAPGLIGTDIQQPAIGWKETQAALTKPAVELPRLSGTGVGSGVANWFIDQVEGATSAEGAAGLALAGPVLKAGPVVARTGAAILSGLQAVSGYEQWKNAVTPGDKAKAVLDFASAALPAVHAVKPDLIPAMFSRLDKAAPEQRAEEIRSIDDFLQQRKAQEAGLPQTAEALKNEQPQTPAPTTESGQDRRADGGGQTGAEVQPASPAGAAPPLKPALVVDGKAEVAQPGENHAAIASRLKQDASPERRDAVNLAFIEDGSHAFTTDEGKTTLNRDEAGKVADENGLRSPEHAGKPLHSEHLNQNDQLQTNSKSGQSDGRQQDNVLQGNDAGTGTSGEGNQSGSQLQESPEGRAQGAVGPKPEEEALAGDWTSATKPVTQKLKLGGGERGGINLSVLSDAAKAAREKAKDLLGAAEKFTPLNVATSERSERLQKSFQEATRAQKEIAREIPKASRQAAVSVWREAGGDVDPVKAQAILQDWAAKAKGEAFKKVATEAQNLTPGEQTIGKKAASAFNVLSARGQQYDILGSHRDNYVPHVWDVDNKFTGVGSSRLQDKFKFAKARTFDTFFDGDQAGFKPKTMEMGKLLPAYIHEMNKVIADRQFVQDVSDLKAADGRPLVAPRGTGQTLGEGEKTTAIVNPRGWVKQEGLEGQEIDQHDYKMLGDQPALNKWRWVESDPKGSSTILKGDLAIHPELAKRIKAMMGESVVREWYNEPSTGLSTIPRAIVKNLDTAQSVMKREMFSLLAPFHQVQEGTHAIGHLVNPFSVEAPDLRNAATQDAAKHGLMLFPEKSSSQNFLEGEGVGGKGGFASQIASKYGGKAGAHIASVIDGYQDYLFHQYIPGLKLSTYNEIVPRNMKRFASELKSGEVSEADVKFLSAQQANAAYGHLNYALMDRNPTIQHILQLSLLAPDFLEARGRFVGQAAKTLLGQKSGTEQFRAIATIAAVQAAAAYTITTLTGGKWDAKEPFNVVHGNRTYTLRSVPSDLQRLLFSGPQSTREFVSARVNPVAQKLDQLRTGLNFRGEKTGTMDTLGEILTNYIPITARSIPGIRDLTETSRNSPVSPLEQLAGSLGVKISRYSPITKVHELANSWMDQQGIDRPGGIYPVSKYEPMRYALEDGDLGRAAAEYQKLLKIKGQTPARISEGFKSSVMHPYTGSSESDAKFATSLKGEDKLMFDNAAKVREGILQKFAKVPGTAPTASRNSSERRDTPRSRNTSRRARRGE